MRERKLCRIEGSRDWNSHRTVCDIDIYIVDVQFVNDELLRSCAYSNDNITYNADASIILLYYYASQCV